MRNAPKVKKGDKVRIVLEGTASEMYGGGISIGWGRHENVVHPEADHVTSIEVTPKPLKVGDSIQGNAAYEALPVGAVVKGGGYTLFRHKTGFTLQDGRTALPPSDRRTLVYLPDGAA